jgi:hypothetical protein
MSLSFSRELWSVVRASTHWEQLLGRPWLNRLKTHRNVIHAASRLRDIFYGNNANPLDEVFPNPGAAFAVVGKKIEISGWNDRAVF